MADTKKSGHGNKDAPPEQGLLGLLQEEGLLTAEKIKTAIQAQADAGGGKLLDLLLDSNALTSDDLYTFLSKHSGAPSIDVRNYEIPRELVDTVPHEFAREHGVLPIDKMGKLLTVGMINPLDTAAIAQLERLTSLKVKPMLCKSEYLRAKIRRYYPRAEKAEFMDGAEAQGLKPSHKPAPAPAPATAPPPVTPATAATALFTRDALLTYFENMDVMPAQTGTVTYMRAMAAAPDKTVRDLAGLAGTDPAVTLWLLRLANSPAYGMSGRIGNVNLAVILLGTQGTAGALLAFESAPKLNPKGNFDYNAFWLRAMFCAAAAMSIAKEKGSHLMADAYTAGLLHDIGRLALAAAMPPDLPFPQVDPHDPQNEQALFGITHSEAGFLLARQWRLPETVALPIRFHHEPNRGAEGELVAEVALAAVMADAHEKGASVTATALAQHKGLLTEIGIDAARAARIFLKVSNTLQSATKHSKP